MLNYTLIVYVGFKLTEFCYITKLFFTVSFMIINIKKIALLFLSGLIFCLPLQMTAKDKIMTGAFYVRIDAPPWAMSVLSPDTGDVYFETAKLENTDSIKLMLIRDYSRFAPDGKGPNYLEIEGKINLDGTFSIDLSRLKEGDLVSVVALKKGYIKLWHTFRFCEKCNYVNMKIIFVEIRNKNQNQKSSE